MAATKRLTAHFIRTKGFYPMPFANRRLGRSKRSLKKNSLFPPKRIRYPVFQIAHDPIYVKSFSERMAEMDIIDDELDAKINIGYENPAASKTPRADKRAWLQNRSQLEKAARLREIKIPLDKVKEAWLTEVAYKQIRGIIKHYGIFRDLFNNAYFYPRLKLSIFYDYDDELVTPVYYGNKISACEARTAPSVRYEADPDAYYSLLCTNPDGHLHDNQSEYLHWFIANIKGNDVEQGETLCTYLPPFPPRGTGFHRFIFILFRHNEKIDFQTKITCSSLERRTFSTLEFFRTHQDHMAPVDLLFFQSEWDDSVTHTFHHILGECLEASWPIVDDFSVIGKSMPKYMEEPAYEFMHPPPYHPAQVFTPHRESFNMYLDKYRDKKSIGEEVIKERLKLVNPFKGPVLRPKYPNALKIPLGTPQWLRTKIQEQRTGTGIWRDLFDN